MVRPGALALRLFSVQKAAAHGAGQGGEGSDQLVDFSRHLVTHAVDGLGDGTEVIP